MSREWANPLVAVISWQSPGGRSGGTAVAMRVSREYGESHWHSETFGEIADDTVTNVHPLVVIDPAKNPEGLEYLHPAHFRAYAVHLRDARRPVAAQMMEFLARQFEAFVPPPPKPDEPQDRYAVVLDADGVEWLRSRDGVWAHSHTEGMRTQRTTRSWSSIAAVEVLSPGVQS